MEYEYRLVARDLAVDGVKRLLPDVVWKIANTELVEGIGLPEVQMICGGKATEGMTGQGSDYRAQSETGDAVHAGQP